MLKTILLTSMLAAPFGARLMSAQTAQPPAERGDTAKAQFALGPRYIHMPERFFVLVRKGREIGAIRLINIEQDSLGNGTSNYESYFQGDGSASFLSANVIKHSGEINIKPMKGVHALAWQPGQNKLWVGKWWFGCLSPSLINMSSHFTEKDNGFEFAPTSAREIGEVDASNMQLRWFRYEPDGRTIVPVLDLPK
jgi:hypothetical protein